MSALGGSAVSVAEERGEADPVFVFSFFLEGLWVLWVCCLVGRIVMGCSSYGLNRWVAILNILPRYDMVSKMRTLIESPMLATTTSEGGCSLTSIGLSQDQDSGHHRTFSFACYIMIYNYSPLISHILFTNGSCTSC